MSLRSPLGRAAGLGSAGHGVAHWWAQRISAVALVPLVPWFMWRLASLPSLKYEDLLGCFQGLGDATLLTAFLLALLYHSELGVRVVLEDYVGGGLRVACLIGSKLAHLGLGLAALLSVARIVTQA
ncbi:succinate dehydrogenase, hydrophobic membrane anchor protein [Candidatus Foliamicus sp.]